MISIYIASYLRTSLTALASQIYKDTIADEVQDFILVLDNGFVDTPLVLRRDYAFQVLCQAKIDQEAKEKAYAVYAVLKEKYNFDYPQPIGTANSPLHICAIKAIQAPQGLGNIGGLYRYTINYEAIAEQATPQQV